jgi:cell fate (sporulation/competence/biofilm development) regulator YmcA (YheA/YmcA/DUF963 family)
MKNLKRFLKTGQVRPLRKIEDVTKEYSSLSHELAGLVYKKAIIDQEMVNINKMIDEKIEHLKKLNKEGSLIQEYQKESKDGEEAVTPGN